MGATYEETKDTLDLHVSSHKRTKWHSPLFYLITEILKDKCDPLRATLIAANTKLIAEDTAYMLNIASSIKHTPISFPQYTFKERHYRFDQYYKTNTHSQHGLSPVHYRETYTSDMPGVPDIVIHVYLTIQGHV